MRIEHHQAALVWITPDAARVVEEAGRTCYRSSPKEGNPGAFINMIIARGHESVLEHASASFRVLTDRGVTHEMVRHRLASYSQESTRYCNYSAGRFGESISVIQPVDLSCSSDMFALWEGAMLRAEATYMAMLADGAPPQLARSVLPNSLATEIVMTANMREWRHFLRLRMSPAAHPDMREVAKQIAYGLRSAAPEFFADMPEVMALP